MRLQKLNSNSKMTEAQIRAAYRIYRGKGLSLRQLAELLYEQFGYSSAHNCFCALQKYFKRYGLRTRTFREAKRMRAFEERRPLATSGKEWDRWVRYGRTALAPRCRGTIRKTGAACSRPAVEGEAYCFHHNPSNVARLREWGHQSHAKKTRQSNGRFQ